MMNGKRRAGHVDSPDLSTPDPPKRVRKRNDDTHFPDAENVHTTQELGEKILSLLKRSQDKNGRLIATEFLELPDRDEYPDYYEHIAMPRSISMIEDNLHAGKYATMTALESDLKRMVQNAKDYNSSKSDIFEDAERIRKALSNFMPKHNPAYQDPEYRAVPTPIPEHILKSRLKTRDPSLSGSEVAPIKLKLNAGGRPRSAPPSEPVEDAPIDDDAEAQLQLLDGLSVQENAINFEVKPSRREIPHYYKVIARPTSINDVRKLVTQGKVASWEDFAQEVRLIWANAYDYNEPGSDIYTMAQDLEAWAEEKMRAYGVQPKVVPRLSLKTAPQPRQLKLKVGGTPAPPANGNSYTVDRAALDRQRIEMASALDRATRDTSQPGSTPAPLARQSSLRRSVSIVDLEEQLTTSTANGHTAPTSEPVKSIAPPPGPISIPTPTLEGTLPRQHSDLKSSPYPATAATPLTNGYHAAVQPLSTPSLYAESTNPMDRKLRDPHKSSTDALLQSITYMTNPLIPPDPRWKLTKRASPTQTQMSYYTYLPHDYKHLRVVPQLHGSLKGSSTAPRRKYKLFVMNNGTIVVPSSTAQVDGVEGQAYDFQLREGENIVVVECISEMPAGERREGVREHEQFEFERVTFYVYLRPKV